MPQVEAGDLGIPVARPQVVCRDRPQAVARVDGDQPVGGPAGLVRADRSRCPPGERRGDQGRGGYSRGRGRGQHTSRAGERQRGQGYQPPGGALHAPQPGEPRCLPPAHSSLRLGERGHGEGSPRQPADVADRVQEQGPVVATQDG